MTKKSLLVDLSALNNFYNGFGQVAYNYGKYFKENYRRQTSDYELTLLLPKKFFGAFGNEVNYLSSSNLLRRVCKYMLPQTDVWHNINHVSRFVPRSKSAKYICTIHDLNGLIPEYVKSQKQINKNYRRIRKHADRADLLVAISNFVRGQIEHSLDIKGKPLKMIYNGVEQLAGTSSVKPDIDIRKPFFFSISVFRERKNFQFLLDMMKLMPEKNLYLAGNNDTEYGRIIKERIEKEDITNVFLLGIVTVEQKTWLYENCEAFLFPSIFEGFGLPVIEAMQFGKPVFSSKETSLGEIGGEFAYFWDNFEAESMKRLIDENLDNFFATPNLSEAEKRYADTFSYKRHFEEYEKIYATI